LEEREFIYNFTKLFFSETVSANMLIENWENSTFKQWYVESVDCFTEMKKIWQKRCSDDVITSILEKAKNKVVQDFNDTMKKNFIDMFRLHGLQPVIFDQLFPSEKFTKDTINTKMLEEFREIEEKSFSK
jgi:CRISPR/Cas system CSM-associated protein Csm3 (group 7 of RAMP superfamily)